MEWDHHFCLVCDRRTEHNKAYCSEPCRAADSVLHMGFQSPPTSPSSGQYQTSQPFQCPPLLSAAIAKNGRAPPALSPPQSATSATHSSYAHIPGSSSVSAGDTMTSHNRTHYHNPQTTSASTSPVPYPSAPYSNAPFPAEPFPSGAGYPGSTSARRLSSTAYGHTQDHLPRGLPPPGKYSHQYPSSLSMANFECSATPAAATPGSYFPRTNPSASVAGGQHPNSAYHSHHAPQRHQQYQAQYPPSQASHGGPPNPSSYYHR